MIELTRGTLLERLVVLFRRHYVEFDTNEDELCADDQRLLSRSELWLSTAPDHADDIWRRLKLDRNKFGCKLLRLNMLVVRDDLEKMKGIHRLF